LINEKPIEPNRDERFDMLFEKVQLFDKDEDMPMLGGQERKELEMLSPETRKYTFAEVEQGFPNRDAIAEARRCLRCYRVATVAV
jgi:formate dehydrogenase beta subunit